MSQLGLLAYPSQVAVPIEALEAIFGAPIVRERIRVTDDGGYALFDVALPPVRQAERDGEQRAAIVDPASATTRVRGGWSPVWRRRLDEDHRRWRTLLRNFLSFVLTAVPEAQFVEQPTSLTVVLPGKRQAGVVPQPRVGGLRVSTKRPGFEPRYVRSEEDFVPVLEWIQSLPPRGQVTEKDDTGA